MARDEQSGWLRTTRPRYGVLGAVATALLVAALVAGLLFDVPLAERGFGLLDPTVVQPGLGLFLWGVVTQFGDPWFLLLMAGLVYLAGNERSLVEAPRDGAFVLAVTFAAFSFVDLLKHVFQAPRPPGAGTVTVPTWVPVALGGVFRNITTGSGYAFPSGHALGTAAVFAAVASQVSHGTATARWTAAALGVALVAASRLVLGVHFLVDVGVGVVAGLGLFGVAAAVGDRRPLAVFGLGTVLGGLAVVATALAPDGVVWKSAQWFGASLGGGLAWYLVAPSTTLSLRGTAAAGLPVAALWVALYLAAPPPVVTVVGTALAAAAIVAAPTVWERLAG